MKVFASGLSIPEAPVLLPDGSWLVTEMGPDRGCVTHLSADGQERRVIAATGRPNGLALDSQGVIWVAETAMRSLVRLTKDGDVQTVSSACDGEPFLFPNDVALGPDGAAYMTDSGILLDDLAPGGELNPDWEDLAYDGRVYRIDRETGVAESIDSGLRFANGIAFGPGGDLYATETLTGAIHRYRCTNGRITGGRELFGNVLDPEGPAGMRGPDGMKFGADGNLYVAVYGQGDVTVLARDGSVLRRIKTPGMLPSNVAFGPAGEGRLYITEDAAGVVLVADVDVEGLPLHT